MVMLVAMGGGELLSFSFGKKGGAAEIFEIGVVTGEMGELPLFPLLIKREGADVLPFRIKKPPTISPTTLHSTRAVREGAVDTESDSAWPTPRVPVPYFGPGPTALGTVCGPGLGAPVAVLE